MSAKIPLDCFLHITDVTHPRCPRFYVISFIHEEVQFLTSTRNLRSKKRTAPSSPATTTYVVSPGADPPFDSKSSVVSMPGRPSLVPPQRPPMTVLTCAIDPSQSFKTWTWHHKKGSNQSIQSTVHRLETDDMIMQGKVTTNCNTPSPTLSLLESTHLNNRIDHEMEKSGSAPNLV